VPVKLSDRSAEFRLADQVGGQWRRNNGSVLIISGPVGVGKTAFLRAAAERVVEHDDLFFSVTASASERTRPLGLVDHLVNSMVSAGMADPFRSKGPVGEHLWEPVWQAIRDFAEKHSLIIGIDDAHFADEQSLSCLGYLIRRIERSPILIMLTESSSHERALRSFHGETLQQPYCHRLRLARLSSSGIAEQLTQRLDAGTARQVTDYCADVTGGNPLLLHALVDDLKATGASPEQPEPGVSFRHAVLRCLHRCEKAMVDVARAVAVFGDAASPALLSEYLSVDNISVRDNLLALMSVGLLLTSRFRHQQACEAVLADIPFKDLPEMHSRAAELLHESGAPAKIVAGQLMAARDQAKAAWRVAILREAAQEAMASGDVVDAVNYLRHASGLCADAVPRAEVTALLADAQWHLDPAKAARHLDRLGSDLRTGLLTGPEALVPVKMLLWRGEFAEADELLRVLERDAGGRRTAGAPDTTVARLWLAFCHPGLTPCGGEGTPDAQRVWSGAMAALTFINSTTTLAPERGQVQELDQILHGIRAGSSLTPALFALVLLIQTRRLEEANRWSERLLDEPWIRRVPMRRGLFELIRSVAALHRGAVEEVREGAQTALDLITPSAWGVVVGIPLSLAVRAATELGDVQSAMSYLNFPVPAAMLDTPFALPYLQALGRYHLAMGDPHVALKHFQSCGDLMARWRIDSPGLGDWRDDAAEALAAVGRAEPARGAVEEESRGVSDTGSRLPAIPQQRGAPHVAPERVAPRREAVREDSGDRLELAHGRADLEAARRALAGADQSDAGDVGTDVEPGTAPSATDVEPDGPRPRQDDPKLGAVHPRRAELTDAERRVAALAAAGATNREIATTLFITVSTVEQHLTKIYRKLNVRRRSGLPDGLIRDLP
jgi:DNA-binding CsgD family transcriptional regulator